MIYTLFAKTKTPRSTREICDDWIKKKGYCFEDITLYFNDEARWESESNIEAQKVRVYKGKQVVSIFYKADCTVDLFENPFEEYEKEVEAFGSIRVELARGMKRQFEGKKVEPRILARSIAELVESP